MSADARDEALVEVAVALPVRGTFHYRIPEHLRDALRFGHAVIVPFGKRHVTGFVVADPGADAPDDAPTDTELKPIEDLLAPDPLFGPRDWDLYSFMARFYLAPLGEALRTALPPGIFQASRRHVRPTDAGRAALRTEAPAKRARAVLQVLSAKGEMRLESLLKSAEGVGVASLAQMAAHGWIEIVSELARATARIKYVDHFEAVHHLTPEHIQEALGRGKVRRAVWDALRASPVPMTAPQVAEEVRSASVTAQLRDLEASGLVVRFPVEVYRTRAGAIESDLMHPLTATQLAAADAVAKSMDAGEFATFLLHGVTGSGKTEVYLHLVEKALAAGKQALVLVPEIALTSQILRRFQGRFGSEVQPSHSGLTAAERYDLWRRAKSGDVRVIVGARSAVFAPFEDVGLIIVDEEHDASYKQDEGLPYNGRDLAIYRARLAGCPCVLGSATPSLESYQAALDGRYRLLELPERVSDRPMPRVEVVDLRPVEDFEKFARRRQAKAAKKDDKDSPSDDKPTLPRARAIFSPDLRFAIQETLEAGEQAILLLNRRGFSTYAFCLKCGQGVHCPNCEVALTYHKGIDRLLCHYCDYSQPVPKKCRVCEAEAIFLSGLGTEQVEHALGELVPEARVARMDRDTVRGRDGHDKILDAFRLHDIDILLGTQMVAKGHDFPNVTLVGVINADTALNVPDFRANERTFQLLAQVAGRAGRATKPGRTIIQTHNPRHEALSAAARHDFDGFFRGEIVRRELSHYPPFTRAALVSVSDMDRREGQMASLRLRHAALGAARALDVPADYVQGPGPAPLAKIKNRYRFQLLIKARDINALRRIGAAVLQEAEAMARTHLRVRVDIDPQNLL